MVLGVVHVVGGNADGREVVLGVGRGADGREVVLGVIGGDTDSGALVLGVTAAAQAATPTYYNNQATFLGTVSPSVTDDYSNGGYVFIQNNAVMSAVLGETDYLVEGRFTVTDIIVGYTLSFGEEQGLLTGFANLEAYLERLSLRPAFLRHGRNGIV